MTSLPPSWKYNVLSENRLCQSMGIILENNLAKFYSDYVWNDVTVVFFEERRPNKNKNNKKNKMSRDMGSVPDAKISPSLVLGTTNQLQTLHEVLNHKSSMTYCDEYNEDDDYCNNNADNWRHVWRFSQLADHFRGSHFSLWHLITCKH